jgi:hypothetical protein
VHEKAVLLIIIPLAYVVPGFTDDRLLTIRRKHYLHSLRIIMVSGCVGLLPLLFTPPGMSTLDESDDRKLDQSDIHRAVLCDSFAVSWETKSRRAIILRRTMFCRCSRRTCSVNSVLWQRQRDTG